MSRLSLNKIDLDNEKLKFLEWIFRWSKNEEPVENVPSDLPELIILFQCLGFMLQKFEKTNISSDGFHSTSPMKYDMINIELCCSKSGMKAALNKKIKLCKCPTKDEESTAQFWSISGCAPNSQERIDTSLSSLLPPVIITQQRVMRDVLNKFLSMIVNETNSQKSKDPQIPKVLARYRSLDTLKDDEFPEANTMNLLSNQISWEVDPKVFPPKESSSPVPDLCKSLEQITLASSEAAKLRRNLMEVRSLIELSIEIASGKNSTFTKDSVKKTKQRISDIKPISETKVMRSTPVDRNPHLKLLKMSKLPASVTPGKRRILTPFHKINSAQQIATTSTSATTTSAAAPDIKSNVLANKEKAKVGIQKAEPRSKLTRPIKIPVPKAAQRKT